ncbi:MAG: biopolymer transporter ExbD [Dysgonamonadaceae bacterium]|jgi:biopolymer transport protein ExbD|nr:biopolymer transporter ExbD [Dysgonamonadaceae bacterium]
MPRFRRNIPQVNATSSADIAFILLLFFLLTGSLNPKLGIYRKLLPDTSQIKLKKKTNIEKRDIIRFSINSENKIFMENEPVQIRDVRNIAREFISNPDNLPNLPRRETRNIENLGEITITPDAVIVLEYSLQADFQTYISVLGELSAAYDELRNELSAERFGKPYSALSEELQTSVREAYPMQISELETNNEEDKQ